MLSLQLLFIVASAFLTDLAIGDFVDPYPVSTCSIAFGSATCPNQDGCCSGGAACCAGGCCPITAWCVGEGTSDEGCCPLDDPTNCGVAVPSYSATACGSSPKPSVQCVSADDDWYCPPGSSCGSSYPQCFGFSSPDCTSSALEPSSPPSSVSDASSSFVESSSTTERTTGDPSGGTATRAASATPSGDAMGITNPGLGILGGMVAVLGLM